MGTGHGGLRTGLLAAFGTEGYEGEPPLLEELGVNFQHIQTKVSYDKQRNGKELPADELAIQTLTVLNPLGRIDHHIMDDADLAGPLLFCALFGTSLLFVSDQHHITHVA